MKNTQKLFEAFGELIYVIAMADGTIQKEEMDSFVHDLTEKLKKDIDRINR